MSQVPVTVAAATSTSAFRRGDRAEEEAFHLDEVVVVTASRIEERLSKAITPVAVVPREEIERSGARNVAEIFESTPGLRVVPDVTGAAQLQLRGFDPDKVLVLVDGQRPSGRKNGAIDLSRLGVERIERVEIVKGPSSAMYGADALAGVVNIVTRAPDGPLEGDLRVSAGGALERGPDDPTVRSLSRLAAETLEAAGRVGGSSGAFAWQATGGYRRRGPYDLNPSTPGLTGSAFEDADLELGGWYRDDALKLRVRLEGSTRELQGIDSGAPLPRGQVRVDDRRQRIRTLGLFVSPELELLDGRLVLEGSWSLYDDRVARIQRGGSDQSEDLIVDQVAQLGARFDRELPEGHRVVIGVDGLYEHLDATRFPDFVDRGRFGAFVQDEWRPLEALSVQAGVRLDVDTQFGAFATPRVAVRYDPLEVLALRASWGLGFKAPLPRDLGILFENPGAGYRVEGNADLSPEETSTFGAGVLLTPTKALSVEVDVFHADITNLITPLPIGGGAGELTVFRYGNVASARIQGVEVGMTWRPVSALRTTLGYDGLIARDLELDQPLPNRAPHRLTAGVGVEIAALGLDLDLRGAWTSRRFIAAQDGPDLFADAYARLDARVAWEATDAVTLFVGGDNLLDAGDPELLAIPPRTLYAGAQSRFR